jgi:hypothetical protein
MDVLHRAGPTDLADLAGMADLASLADMADGADLARLADLAGSAGALGADGTGADLDLVQLVGQGAHRRVQLGDGDVEVLGRGLGIVGHRVSLFEVSSALTGSIDHFTDLDDITETPAAPDFQASRR